jgi:hypothetical protein
LRSTAGPRAGRKAAWCPLAHRPGTTGKTDRLGSRARGEVPDEGGEHGRVGRSVRGHQRRTAVRPYAEESPRLRLPDAAESFRGRVLRARLQSRRNEDPAARSTHRPRSETRLSEAAQLRLRRQRPRVGSGCRAGRLLSRRAAGSHIRQREAGRDQRTPRRALNGSSLRSWAIWAFTPTPGRVPRGTR